MQNQVSIHQIKFEAKQLKKEHGIQHSKALEIVSKAHGFQDWHHANQVADTYTTPVPVKFKDNTSFRFIMDRKDFSGSRNADYFEDDELFEFVLSFGLKKGLTEIQASERLEDLIFLRHKTALPDSALQACTIINRDFFFPPICLWLNGLEHTSATALNDESNVVWQGYSYRILFDDESIYFD